MNFFEYFYCKAFDYYNTSGKKSIDTLRVSAIALLTGFQAINVLTIIFVISLLRKKTIGNEWVGLVMFALVLFYNFINLNKQKSENLREELYLLDKKINKKKKIALTIYIILSLLFFLLVVALTVYFKKKYGNYDLD